MDRFIADHDQIDVGKLTADIEKRIQGKMASGLLKQREIDDIEDMELLPIPDFQDIPNVFDPHLFTQPGPVDYQSQERGPVKAVLKRIRRLVFPLIRFMIRPISAELKTDQERAKEYIKLLHNTANNMIIELTKMRAEVDLLKTKTRLIEERQEFLENRERAVEKRLVRK